MSKSPSYDLPLFNQQDSFGRVVDDGRQTLAFAGAALDLVERTTSSALRKRAAVQSLREKLGEWADEAVDNQGRWLRPLLTVEAFEEHMISKDGRVIPSTVCQSSLGWAHLLYALDIRPGRGILSWKLPSVAFDPTRTGEIPLSIEGEVLCHIVNLYRFYLGPTPEDFSTLGVAPSSCRFPFGTLLIVVEDRMCIGTFDSGAPEVLCLARVPFAFEGHPVGFSGWGKCLSLGEGLIIAKYYNTIHHGASDKALFLRAPSAPLQERARSLLTAMDYIGSRREPFLLTQSWIEQASRVKRRVTTNGGSDYGIIEDVLAFLSTQRGDINKQGWEVRTRTYLLRRFMFKGNVFKFTLDDDSPELIDKVVMFAVLEALKTVLKRYAAANSLNEHPSGVVRAVLKLVNWQSEDKSTSIESWKTELAALGPDLEKVFHLEHEIWRENRIVLELTPESPLWKTDCQIRG